MNIIMFIVGAVIFTVFLIGDASEVKTNEKVNDENYGYYARHQPEKDELKEEDKPMDWSFGLSGIRTTSISFPCFNLIEHNIDTLFPS